MDRWAGRVVLVTGASAGIGRAIASRLVKHGMVVVACARNFERLQELKAEHSGAKGTIVPIQCDVRKVDEILAMFERIKGELGGVDVCINNAGVVRFRPLLSGSTDEWRDMLDINILATSVCARESIKSMMERGVDDGFVINIGSDAGHMDRFPDGLAFYASTKHTLRALTRAVKSELQEKKSRIKCLEISPGLVKTDIIETSSGKDVSDKLYAASEALSVEDIADSVVYILSAAPRAMVAELMILPIDMPNLSTLSS